MIQKITLAALGYVAALASDIGELVSADAVTIGTLSSYDNTNRIWYINSPEDITVGQAIEVVSGTGSGVCEVASTSTVYCLKSDIQDRLLIKSTETTYDDSLDSAIEEASRTVDIFLKPYEEVPLTTYSEQITIITADFASSIFKRRYIPQEVKFRGTLQPDMINDVDGTGWFAVGLKKLLDYIKSYYALATTPHDSGVMVNPEIYMELFKNGTLTLKEARELMADADSVINRNINEAKTAISTITETKDMYHTKKQKSFSFIEGDPNTYDTYKEQDDA